MQYEILLAEAIFVGVYCTLLYGVLRVMLPLRVIPTEVLYFYLGVYKHMLGYFAGMHDYYCNNGYACHIKKYNEIGAIGDYIIFDSILEGILFVCVCKLFMYKKLNAYTNMFIIGFLMHLFAELFGIHSIFCKYRCTLK